MNRPNVKEIEKLVGDKFFTATFIKKDGSLRTMNCRLGVKKHLKGGEKKYNTEIYNYLTVYDMQKKGYRTININTLKELKIGTVTLHFNYGLYSVS
jgi:hypothetical protein